MMKKMNLSAYLHWVTAIFLVLIVIISVPSIANYGDKSDAINVDTIQNTVQKYVVQCYAVEGSYPADLYYLEENYGLILDEEKYIYDYEVFASNVMPDIEVYLKK
ncbi:MAG: hypothetical protein H7X94_04910 [Vallitaleaceae bacterium]|nr:hypothetical protein [Vallitaleaceae bacterium]